MALLSEKIKRGERALRGAGFTRTWQSPDGQRQTWVKEDAGSVGRKFTAQLNAGAGRVNISARVRDLTVHTDSVTVFKNRALTIRRLQEAVEVLKWRL